MTVQDVVDLLKTVKDKIIEPREVGSKDRQVERIRSASIEGDAVQDPEDTVIVFEKAYTNTDFESNEDGGGLILTSPDGREKKRIYVGNDGNVATEDV